MYVQAAMFDWLKAQGPTFNAILITALAAIGGVLAFSFIGWLGVALLGLAVLLIGVQIDLHEDSVAGDATMGLASFTRQVAERAKRDPRHRKTEAAGRAKVVAVLKYIGLALAIFGFAMLLLGG